MESCLGVGLPLELWVEVEDFDLFLGVAGRHLQINIMP